MVKIIERPETILLGIEDITRRDFLVGGAAALLLAGCGSNGGNESSGETRTVEGHYGPVELPVEPQRVIPGGTFTMDYALVLGLPLAAGSALFGAGEQSYPEYQREAYPEKLEDLEIIQTEPMNYEQVAGLVRRNPRMLSLEILPEVDADVILLSLRWQEGSLERDLETVATYVDSPLWQRLPAVQKDQVYRFDAELHYISPLCAQAFLDFVEGDLIL